MYEEFRRRPSLRRPCCCARPGSGNPVARPAKDSWPTACRGRPGETRELMLRAAVELLRESGAGSSGRGHARVTRSAPRGPPGWTRP